MKESKLQKTTIELLAANGFLAFPIEYRGRRGCPDLMVFGLQRPGVVVFLELKTRIGKLSQIQVDNRSLYRVWQQIIAVVCDPEDALTFVQEVFSNGERTTSNG